MTKSTPFRWYGGKGHHAPKIVSLLPEHAYYCEPFFGAGSVFFRKRPCEHETINDIDNGVTLFFRVLRDSLDEFIARAALTEHNEALFKEFRLTWQDEPDDVVRAWKWWVVASFSFAGAFGSSMGVGRSIVRRGMPQLVSGHLGRIAALPEFSQRLQQTQILSGDGVRAMTLCDLPECLHYVDPPYPKSVRKVKAGYVHDGSDDLHERLLGFLLEDLKGMAVVSGYPGSCYDQLDAYGWRRMDLETSCWAAAKTRATGQVGQGSQKEKQPRVESLWFSPTCSPPEVW